jgi:iron complex transport system substrate-binding protein
VDIQAAANQFYQAVFGAAYTGPSLGGAPPAATRKITDMLGRQVEIPAHLSRVVTVFPYVTFAALALGGEKTLVAIDSASAANANLARLYPVVKRLPAVGSAFSVNKESVLMAKPDVVVTVSWDSDPDKTQTTLGVPLVCVDMDKYKESIEFIAELFGPEAQVRAKELVGYYEQKEALIAEKTAGVAASQRPKVYVGGGNGFLSAFGKESTWHFEIEDAKGINVSADLVGGGSHEVSMEQLITWNPDVIVLDKSCADTLSSVLSDARWQPINAVKNKRVYRAPNGFLDTWGRPHLESALCRLWLADKLYPGKLGIDIVEEAKAFYAKFYGVTLSNDEITKLLNPE